ncbi:DUF2807 domain-containing protein [Sphingomonas daechungensis]|uniref:DUF2807 domain-containing protein n=1 Tax=Sphingomonas daechungensis TaxID=1176646 RepID=A0ABX6T449_9SPHN|nr:DUF2807 domain-containing protein [Sphingomonas daechungensis]QNP44236.1 DUF2807 domain-containing protein [Sphingomonas daechungensis]
MKTAILAICAAAIAQPALAADRTLSVTSFNKIRIDGPYKVRLTTGVSPFATVSGSAAAIDAVSIDQQGQTLVVRGNPSSWAAIPGRGQVQSRSALGRRTSRRSGSTAGRALGRQGQGPQPRHFHPGSGSAAIANANVDQLKVGISGVGTVSLAGTAPKLTAIVRGTSSLDASGLAVKDATVGAEGPPRSASTSAIASRLTRAGCRPSTCREAPHAP